MLKYSDGDLTVTLTDTGTVTFSNAASSLPAATATTTVTTTEAPPVQTTYLFLDYGAPEKSYAEMQDFFSNRSYPGKDVISCFIYDDTCYIDNVMQIFGFSPTEVSYERIEYRNGSDSFVLTPIFDADYPDVRTSEAVVTWTRADGTTVEWSETNTAVAPTICYSASSTQYPTLEFGKLFNADFARYYCPDGFTLPNGTFVSPDDYNPS